MTRIQSVDFGIWPVRFRKFINAMVGRPWLMLLIFSLLYFQFIFLYGWEYRNIPNVDLPSFYAASARFFRYGESPYDLAGMRLFMSQDTRYVYPFVYPPQSLLLFFPLSELTYAHARLAVLLVNHLIFLVMMWVIPVYLLRVWPRRGLAFALCVLYLITFHPVAVTLNHGQVNIMLLASIVLFWLSARRGSAVLAGFFLALAVLLKTYPLIAIPFLLLIGRWRESAYALAWLGLATMTSLMLIPNPIWHDWITIVLPAGGYTGNPPGLASAAIWNQSLNGVFSRAFTENRWSEPFLVDPGLARLLTYGSAGLATAVTAIAVWRSRSETDSLDRVLLAALPLMYLVAPFSWEHHLVYLLPSILMLFTSRSSLGLLSRNIFYALCFISALVISLDYFQAKFFGVLVLWGLCVFAAGSKDVELPGKRQESRQG
jgi:hypothetical protein